MATKATPQQAASAGGSIADKIFSTLQMGIGAYAAERTGRYASMTAGKSAPYIAAGVGVVAVAIAAVFILSRK